MEKLSKKKFVFSPGDYDTECNAITDADANLPALKYILRAIDLVLLTLSNGMTLK